MNALALDYTTFGNHEFDLKRDDLLQRMAESKFTWIGTNVFNHSGTSMFDKTVPYQLIIVKNVRILLFSITIDSNLGDSTPYVTIVNSSSLKPFVQQFLKSLTIEYDVLVALTHLEITTDIMLAESVPDIDVIMGGHEHENIYLIRGRRNTAIYKTDGNTFSVFIHRFAYNLDSKILRLFSTLVRITPDIVADNETASVANYWFNAGINGFTESGYQPYDVVAHLPEGIELDGRSSSIRYFSTLLSDYICQSLKHETNADIGLYHTGTIRLDDILSGTISQYDILRTVPFPDIIVKLTVPDTILNQVLTYGATQQGSGRFLSYCGFNVTNKVEGNLTYSVATLEYTKSATGLSDPSVTVTDTYGALPSTVIRYLKLLYPNNKV
ncbi:unnamed protein product, partial [Didymodactylos carnosus]